MSRLLAPYNNAMRLGQGFNSFTQQICLSEAVSQDPDSPARDGSSTLDNGTQGISQIVSYSSRFVNKISDVTDSMNVSASLSIKTSTIGGNASGQYIDTDKFKESDLNYFMQVKVSNQSHMAHDYTLFNKIEGLPKEEFTNVYGDCFISGFEEGGEFNALLSVKVLDKSKTTQIQAKLEATLGTPALSGALKGDGNIDKSSMDSDTETTITVNWCGGGQVKQSNVIWDITSLTAAACNFPELVAMTPQRTYAILTKYSNLPSFYKEMKDYSALDYENAGIYASALLDAYMDYKSLWKTIQKLQWDFEHEVCTLGVSSPSQELLEWATASQIQPTTGTDSTANKDKDKPTFVPSKAPTTPYSPSLVGLQKARRDCRLEMIKIVNEVDLVTDKPGVAEMPGRDWVYLSPTIFKTLIPIRNPPPPKVDPLLVNFYYRQDAPLLTELQKYKDLVPDFRVARGFAGWNLGAEENPPKVKITNDLPKLKVANKPVKIQVWQNDNHFIGIETTYKDQTTLLHGRKDSNQWSSTVAIPESGWTKSILYSGPDSVAKKTAVNGIKLFAGGSQIQQFTKNRGNESVFDWAEDAPDGFAFGGFWSDADDDFILRLGVIWMRLK